MTTIEKINKAIATIKETKVKKEGWNDYSGYDYFTPGQIDRLIFDVTKELNLFVKFDLERNELGITGKLSIHNLDDIEDVIFYVMATAIPSIKATNDAQQLGGAMTYTKRYMLMNAFDITDNNLDFDTPQNTKKREEDKTNWLTKEQFLAAIDSDVKGISATLSKYDTATHKMKKVYKEQLEAKLNELI